MTAASRLFMLLRRKQAATPAPKQPWYQLTGLPLENVVAAYLAKGAADELDTYKNLVNPDTHPLDYTHSGTWTPEDGWHFDGYTNYLISDIVPADGWSVAVRFANGDPESAERYLLGVMSSAPGISNNGFYLSNQDDSGACALYCMGGPGTGYDGVLPEGVIAMSDGWGFMNGLKNTESKMTAWTGTQTYPIYIGAACYPGGLPPVAVGFHYIDIQAVVFYNSSLNDPQIAELSAKMAAL